MSLCNAVGTCICTRGSNREGECVGREGGWEVVKGGGLVVGAHRQTEVVDFTQREDQSHSKPKGD